MAQRTGKNRAKLSARKKLGSKFFQIFRVMAQSPVDVFRGFVQNRAFWRPKESLEILLWQNAGM